MFPTRRHSVYPVALLLCSLDWFGCAGAPDKNASPTTGGASPIGAGSSTTVEGGGTSHNTTGAGGNGNLPSTGGRDAGQGGTSALPTTLGGTTASSAGGSPSLGGLPTGAGATTTSGTGVGGTGAGATTTSGTGASGAGVGGAGAGGAGTGGAGAGGTGISGTTNTIGSGGINVAKGGGAGSSSIASGGTAASAGSSSVGGAICPNTTSFPTPTLGSATRVVTGSGNGLYEGTVWVASRGTLFFSDISFDSQPNPSTLRVLTPPSSVQALVNSAGTNGLALAPHGMIIGAAHDVQGIVSFDPSTGSRTVLLSKYQGKSFNSPNDVTVRSDGTIYFTDPDYMLGGRTAQIGFTGVYRASANGQQIALIDDTLPQPNGIALSPDEQTLYVAVMGTNKVIRFAVAADGSTSSKQDFIAVTEPDGLGIDCAGNLYVASHNAGVLSVFAPTGGTAVATVTVAAKITNIAFGGGDRKTIYVSAGKGIYTIAGAIPGYPN